MISDILYKCHKKYGRVVKLWLGPTQLLVSIEDTELIKEVLLKAEDKLPLTGRAFHLAFGKSSLFISRFGKVRYAHINTYCLCTNTFDCASGDHCHMYQVILLPTANIT